MGHIFRPGITGCRPGPNLILLDVCRDRYIGLGDAARDACLRLVEGQPAAIGDPAIIDGLITRSEEHTSELQSLMRISYAVFCLKKKKNKTNKTQQHRTKQDTPDAI